MPTSANLTKLIDGIYTLGQIQKPIESPVVLVHPFFDNLDHEPEYVHGILNLIKETKRPIIVFEESRRINEAAGLFELLERKKGVYFIPTKAKDTHPTRMSWERLMTFMAVFPQPFYVAGGYVGDTQGYRGMGCLTSVVNRLEWEDLDVEVLKELTFDRK
jgi:hypothetical protein